VFFDDGNTVTVSEAMGYGMMIVPVMAGYDPNAKTCFDGLYRYYKAHPSSMTPHLMAWKQITGCVNADGDDSASDGDIDIAFGLLLAHEQWGSDGEIDYLKEAKLIISDLMGSTPEKGDINQTLNTVKLGDWVTSGKYMTSTRTSDFITDHFRVFACVSDDSLAWTKVVDKCYDLVSEMQTNYSPQTGLLPDFIVNINTSAEPAQPDFLEGDLDGHYSYNACRDPWRIGFDYLINGDERALNAVKKINEWLYQKTGGNPSKVYAGYYLNGNAAVDWTDVSFTAPFTVGAMLATTKQQWLNKLYDKVLSSNTSENGYYGNTLKLLSMLVISGNFITPSCGTFNNISSHTHMQKEYFTANASDGRLTVYLKTEAADKKMKIAVRNITGSLLSEQTVSDAKKITIDIPSSVTALYLVSLYSTEGKNLETKKVSSGN
jgi:endo-1,4-beta-D-glucanase Y